MKKVETDNRHYGIDVSHHNGKINWNIVASAEEPKIEFAFIKATEGESFTSPAFIENWQGISATKLGKGAYHFYRTTKEPQKQAAHFSQTLEQNQFDKLKDCYALDIETNDKKLNEAEFAEDLGLFIKYMKNDGFITKPYIYTTSSFWNQNLGLAGEDLLANSNLWIARWYKNTGTVPPDKNDPGDLPLQATDWHIWQFTSKGSIAGINTEVDIDVAHYTNLDEINLAGQI